LLLWVARWQFGEAGRLFVIHPMLPRHGIFAGNAGLEFRRFFALTLTEYSRLDKDEHDVQRRAGTGGSAENTPHPKH